MCRHIRKLSRPRWAPRRRFGWWPRRKAGEMPPPAVTETHLTHPFCRRSMDVFFWRGPRTTIAILRDRRQSVKPSRQDAATPSPMHRCPSPRPPSGFPAVPPHGDSVARVYGYPGCEPASAGAPSWTMLLTAATYDRGSAGAAAIGLSARAGEVIPSPQLVKFGPVPLSGSRPVPFTCPALLPFPPVHFPPLQKLSDRKSRSQCRLGLSSPRQIRRTIETGTLLLRL